MSGRGGMGRGIATIAAAVLAFAGLAETTQAQASASPYTSATRYDALGRVTGTISSDPDGPGGNPHLATRTTYDQGGRPTKVESGYLYTWPGNSEPKDWIGFNVQTTRETTYDVLDRKLTERLIGQDLATYSLTQYSYDLAGRLECTAVRMNRNAYGSLPTSACDLGPQGNDGPDRITRNVYDKAGQLLQIREAVGIADNGVTPDPTNPGVAEVTYSYTGNGKIRFVIDAAGNRAEMRYDGHDRQVRWVFPRPTCRPGECGLPAFDDSPWQDALATAGALNEDDSEIYEYDENGNRTKLIKRDGSELTYQCDKLNRMVAKIVPDRADLQATHERDVHYRYDLRGLTLWARFDSHYGEGVTFGYDGFGRKTAEVVTLDGVSRALSSQYDLDGNRTLLFHPDGRHFNYYRDGLGRLYYAAAEGNPLFQPAYNAAGRLYVKYGWSTSLGDWGFGTVHLYDPVGRLANFWHSLPGTSHDSTWFLGYNPASQIVSWSRDNDLYAWNGQRDLERQYVPDGLNRYGTVGGAAFTYDDNGNLTSDGLDGYRYDVENRMVERTADGTTYRFRYDPLGRFYEYGTLAGGGAYTPVRRYYYDGDDLVVEYNADGTMANRYVHGTGAGDDPMVWFAGASLDNSARSYFYTDERGSIVAVTDSTGGVLNVLKYDEYGIPAGTNASRFQYTGQAWHPAFGMYYYKARLYSPHLGRFMQTDPIGYEDQFNLYAYVGNDPVNGVDPSGTQAGPGQIRIAEKIVETVKEDPGILIDAAAIIIDVATFPSGEAAAVIAARRGARELVEESSERGARQATCCFVAGTLIDTEDGLRSIEDIEVGDKVWSRNEATGETALKKVTDLIRRHERVLWEVSLTGPDGEVESFETTDDHPWWIAGIGWKRTEELQPRMAVVTRDGRGMILVSVTETRRTDATYNLTVADFETYFVGEQRVLVHNCPPGTYVTPGERTPSNREYVGQTSKDSPNLRPGNGTDGRVREAGDQTTSMPGSTRREREIQEQREMNERGGVDNLDNQRNSVDPKLWKKFGIDPPR